MLGTQLREDKLGGLGLPGEPGPALLNGFLVKRGGGHCPHIAGTKETELTKEMRILHRDAKTASDIAERQHLCLGASLACSHLGIIAHWGA